jgi:hypothetical protein
MLESSRLLTEGVYKKVTLRNKEMISQEQCCGCRYQTITIGERRCSETTT